MKSANKTVKKGKAFFKRGFYYVSVCPRCPECENNEEIQVIAVRPENEEVSEARARFWCPKCKKIFLANIKVDNISLESQVQTGEKSEDSSFLLKH